MAATTLGWEVKVSEGDVGSNGASNEGKSTRLVGGVAELLFAEILIVEAVGSGILGTFDSNLCSILVTHGDGGGDA